MTFLSNWFLLVLLVAGKGSAVERIEGKEEAISHHYHTVKLSSFISSSICSPSTKRANKKGSLEVVHKHGPCSKLRKHITKPMTMEKILTHDQSRVDSIRSRLTTKTSNKATTIPANSGTVLDTGTYIVTLGIGTPKKEIQLIMDTGSSLTWTQCQPCAGACYSQQEAIFTPSLSTTYTNISCTSTDCSLLPSATGNLPQCSSTTCVYGIQYGDGSSSVGELAKEKLTLTADDRLENFMFGCGQTNQGDYGTASGLLGLGDGELSIVSQSAAKYGKVFSYCLPSTDSASGFLTFGSSQVANNATKYTRLLSSQPSSGFYNVELTGITVGRTRTRWRPSTMFVMDSGTIITRLPMKDYVDIRKAFRAEMRQYPLTKPVSILDTCYDLSNYTDVKLPKISMVFGGNVSVDIPPQGTLIEASPTQMCLPFAGNEDESDPSIFGNVQQMTMEIIYDMPAGKIGFSPGACA